MYVISDMGTMSISVLHRFNVDFTGCGLGFFNQHRKSASRNNFPNKTPSSLFRFGTDTKDLRVLSTESDIL